MNSYQAIFSKFNQDEMKQLAQIKRYFERLQCDHELAKAVNQNSILPAQFARLKETGVLFDPSELPLGQESEKSMATIPNIPAAISTSSDLASPS